MILPNDLKEIYKTHPSFNKIHHFIDDDSQQQIFLKGILTSPLSILIALLYEKHNRDHLILMENYEYAAYFFNDLLHFLPEKNVLFFPSSYRRSSYINQKDNAKIVIRTKTLEKLSSDNQRFVIVTYPEAASEKILSKRNFDKHILQIKQGEIISRDFLSELLVEQNLEPVDFVEKPGQFAVRGSLFDVFSFAEDMPFRIDFSGDEIDSIRTFDISTQLSIHKIDAFTLLPNLMDAGNSDRVVFTNYLSQNCVIWKKNPLTFPLSDNTGFVSETEFSAAIKTFKNINFGLIQHLHGIENIVFKQHSQPLFHKNFRLLIENLQSNTEIGYKNFIFSDNPKQIERIQHIFEDRGEFVDFKAVSYLIHEGFIDDDLKIACYTEHQIFNRYHKLRLKSLNAKRSQQKYQLQKLHELHPGDYVVHIDHGIGQFGGLQEMTTHGKKQEVVRIVYRNNDLLLVNLHSLHKISKYKGKDGIAPKIDKLGGVAWQKLKQRTKRKIKDIAKDLIKLYAERKAKKGFMFSPDTYLQDELEVSFIYKDTPDQEHATKAVKEDMELPYPMDRLICGDVGFGKTEVAIRAAFKAVADNNRWLYTSPTTILAFQHFNTFTERLKNLPCTVEYLSRFKSTKQQKEILNKIAEGKIDIIIGTHRIVSKDLIFRDLGLLVVDEEQKFGVGIKEKLRKMKVNVDTLTLTATPIPRTLQFSLMGARDLSIINTPPPNRYPILTEIHNFNENIIHDAILYEVNRGGQVFFMHNRIQNIHKIQALLNRILPNVSTKIAHGQMKGNELEDVMLRFMQGEFDVLVSTSIIESGLDIPNANTIIINHAHNFGLSDLYQLRGRVGRSATKAFCYLLTPPVSLLTSQARERLKAIEEFSDLGSGFNIAMKDLDIRGAGNLLGSEQSGFIADIGLETYQKILDEALIELRKGEFKNLYHDEIKNGFNITDCQIETDFEIYIPNSYIESTTERIKTYRALNNLQNEEQLERFEYALIDKFGEIPEKVRKLIDVVRLRWMAMQLGFERMILKNELLRGYFVSKSNSDFYQSTTFETILLFLKEQLFPSSLQEKNDKLILIVKNIHTIEEALEALNKMVTFNKN